MGIWTPHYIKQNTSYQNFKDINNTEGMVMMKKNNSANQTLSLPCITLFQQNTIHKSNLLDLLQLHEVRQD